MNSPATVLIIDDVEDSREVYAQFLRHFGYRVQEASDGAQGIAQARAIRPHVIVLDLAMPNLDGIETCRRFKADPETREIPVVVLTARAYPSDRAEAEAAGCDLFLVKPCTPELMMKSIEAIALEKA
jgi:CheY-like chemotaxis protein